MTASSSGPAAVTQPASLSPVQQAILEIRSLRTRLEASESRSTAPVAIVGVACRFPGQADSLAKFWQLLEGGVDAIGDVPSDRWDVERWYDPDPAARAKMSTRSGGFLDNVDQFDAEFFGISDREAVSIDPQHRLLLEAGWDALADSGLTTDAVFKSRTGVFVGISSFDYAILRGQTGDLAEVDAYHATGIAHSAAAGRLSYYFGLQGPSISVDTACSSSLLAIHLACQSLRLRDCDAALAGGVNLILSPELHVTLSKARMMAPDGRCKAFDAAADGFVRSEGCGMLVLRRLDDALRDGDRIHAVIRGSACNQDGRSSGFSAPNGPSQTSVVRAAWRAAGVRPEDIGYVEAHGTGTSLGDPIEAGALAAALKDTPDDHVLAIGSVKTNVGHMEAAAGVGGVIKTLLAMRHERLPASLHFKQGSPNIEWAGSRLKVVAEATPWPRGAKPRLAGVSSFGFTGTNVHVVVEEPPLPPDAPDAPSPTRILTMSATSEQALAQVADQLGQTLREIGSDRDGWADVTFTANARRSHHPVRAAVVVHSPEEAAACLAGLARGEPGAAVFRGRANAMATPAITLRARPVAGPSSDPRTADLYAASPVFRNAVDTAAGWLEGQAEPLTPTGEQDRRAFVMQWALAQTWCSWSGEPAAVIGEDFGAYVAACIAGVLSPEDAMTLVVRRRACLDAASPDRAAGAIALFRAAVAAVTFAAPRLPAPAGGSVDAAYWLAELDAARQPMPAQLVMGAREGAVVLDLAPQPSAGHMVPSEHSTSDRTAAIGCAQGPSLHRSMLQAAAALYVRGVAIDWRAVEGARPGRAADLPPVPWSRRSYWFPKAAATGQSAAAWDGVIATLGRQADQVPIDLHVHSYEAKYRILDRLATAYILRTLDDLRALGKPGASLTADLLVSGFGVLPLYRQLMAIWLDKLADKGHLQRFEHGFTAVQPGLAEPVAALESEAQALFDDAPMLLTYVKGCGALLTAVLEGKASPLDTLFPGGKLDLAEELYHRAAISRYFNALVGAAARSFAAGRPGRLRVIEVGAGTGGVTGSVLAELPADRSRYTFSDVSSFFFSHAAGRFAGFDFVDYVVLDLEQSPQSQGFEAAGYDLVVAANVLHATKDLGQTLDFVRSLLAPGGALLLYEVTDPPAYFDVSIALIEGWQKSSDSIRGIGPLLDTNTWKALLPKHGFETVEAWPSPTSPAAVLGSHVFMARATEADASLGSRGAVSTPSATRRAPVAVAAVAPVAHDDVGALLLATPESEHRSVLVDFVRRQVAAVLKRPEAGSIPADRRLMDLGLDSLMAVELRNVLAKGLHLEQGLPATLMFDHPSIADIAGFLLSLIGRKDSAVEPSPEPRERTAATLPPRVGAAQLEALSDADVEKLLNERLEHLDR